MTSTSTLWLFPLIVAGRVLQAQQPYVLELSRVDIGGVAMRLSG